MSPLLITIIAVFLGTATICVWLGSVLVTARASDPLRRLAKLQGGKRGEAVAIDLLKRDPLAEGAAGLAAFCRTLGLDPQAFNRWIKHIELPCSLHWVVAIGLCSGLAFTLAAILLRAHASTYPLAGIVGVIAPIVPLFWRRKRRLTLFAKQLPDALELMASALRAGNTLQTAMQVIVDEMMAPISTEFESASEAIKLGIPVEQALQELADRMPNPDLQFFATAVAMQRQSGGNLSEILEKISWLVRERFYIQGQVMALTGEGRMSGWVLMALPVILFFIVYALNPGYVMLLFTEKLGQQMLAGAVVMQVLGAIAIRHIVNIKI